MEDDDLERGLTSARLRLERARVVLKHLEMDRQKKIAAFRELTKTSSSPVGRRAWLQWILNKIQLWRIDRALAKIESVEGQIKTHKQGTIAPLEGEIQALEEERTMRAALLRTAPRQAPSGSLPGNPAETPPGP